MSWMAKLYETYEVGTSLDLPGSERLMPISHTLQNAHVNIVIDGDGNFRRGSVLEKRQVILPATESSAGRSSGEAPHPLADKIQYVAKDYAERGGIKKPYFTGYQKQLRNWCDSQFSHPKVRAVLKYISKGSVIADLINEGILHVDANEKLRTTWPLDVSTEQPVPRIFKVLPKQKEKGTEKSITDQGAALVCWSVESEGDLNPDTWTDPSVQESWIQFDALAGSRTGLCFITGENKPLAVNHPAKLRHTGDKAKLISANDLSGFTFRGRFTDSKKSIVAEGNQSLSVSFEVTQKAHNALRWLISRQGYRNADQVYVAWAVSGKSIPAPLEDPWAILSKSIVLHDKERNLVAERIDHGLDMGESFAQKFNAYLKGYGNKLASNEQIVVMGLDSATPGRMGIIYYREFVASEFLTRLESWHSQFAWPQRHTLEVPSAKKRGKPKNKTVWPNCAPVPRSIAEAAYGNILKSNDKLKKSVIERILPCIVDGRPFPEDIVCAAVRRACNRNHCKLWEWERNLGVACALYKGFHLRQPEHKRREYSMALEEDSTSRDYLYGRLLAIAERIEEIALSVGGENRPTTAARLMQRFADRPFSTWRNIELGLQPYMQRLQSSRPGFLTNRKKELDAVSAAFKADDFGSEKSLSGEFLLGYHCQRLALRKGSSEPTS